MNRHENQTMKIFGKRLTAGLLGAALVMSMPFASPGLSFWSST